MLNNNVRETNISAAPSMHVCNRPVSLDCCDITIKIMLGGTFSSPRVYQLSSSQVGTCNTLVLHIFRIIATKAIQNALKQGIFKREL